MAAMPLVKARTPCQAELALRCFDCKLGIGAGNRPVTTRSTGFLRSGARRGVTVRWRFRSLAACSHGAASQPGAGGGLGLPAREFRALWGPRRPGARSGRSGARPGGPERRGSAGLRPAAGDVTRGKRPVGLYVGNSCVPKYSCSHSSEMRSLVPSK